MTHAQFEQIHSLLVGGLIELVLIVLLLAIISLNIALKN
jgi:hypothetical protein